LAESASWRVRRGSSIKSFSDRLVVQGRVPGVLELSVCLFASGRVKPGGLGLLGPLAAACTSEGIRRATGIVSWLHWPDLVTIGGRVVAKTSFSLAAPPESDGTALVVYRTLVNCYAGIPGEFPPDLPSTSILDALGVEIEIDLLRDKVLHALDWYHAEWVRGMDRKLVERIQPTIAWLGRIVEVNTADDRVLRGMARGLDESGSLLIGQQYRKGRGKTRAVPPESVELVRAVN